MAIGRRRRNKQQKKQQKAIESAYNAELDRQREVQKAEQQRDVWQTTEGQGIMEGAQISLGFDDEEEDDELFSGTGLII